MPSPTFSPTSEEERAMTTQATPNPEVPAFAVSFWSNTHGKYVCGKRRYPSVTEALAAAAKAEAARTDGRMVFIDIAPKAA